MGNLIETGVRDALPKGLSYAVGAEIISNALQGVPQYGDLWLSFSRKSGVAVALPSDRPDLQAFQGVLMCTMNFRGESAPYISMYAVPSTRRAFTRDVLVRHGLPKLRAWLAADRADTWRVGLRTFAIGVDFSSSRMCFAEAQYHKVIALDVQPLGVPQVAEGR
jgi:hypothetical protein